MVFSVFQGIDNQAVWFIQSFENPLVTLFFQGITLLGNPATWFILGILLYWTGREKASFQFLTVALFAMLAAGVLKIIFDRPRPSSEEFKLIFKDFHSQYSFPSGHATTIAAYFVFLKNKLTQNNRIIFGVLVLLVMISRLYVGAHFLTDVLAGLLLGVFIGWFAKFFFRELKTYHVRLTHMREEVFFIATLAVAFVALFFLVDLKILAIFLGYYAGFFLFKELALKQSPLPKLQLVAKLGAGLVGTAILAIPPYLEEGLIEPQLAFMLMFLAGFWTSFLFPFLFEKFGLRG